MKSSTTTLLAMMALATALASCGKLKEAEAPGEHILPGPGAAVTPASADAISINTDPGDIPDPNTKVLGISQTEVDGIAFAWSSKGDVDIHIQSPDGGGRGRFVNQDGGLNLRSSDGWDSGNFSNTTIAAGTLYYEGVAFDGQGRRLAGNISSNPTLRSPSFDYSGMESGWARGFWHRAPGDYGVFLSGTPRTVGKNRSVGAGTYRGAMTGYSSEFTTGSSRVVGSLAIDINFDLNRILGAAHSFDRGVLKDQNIIFNLFYLYNQSGLRIGPQPLSENFLIQGTMSCWNSLGCSSERIDPRTNQDYTDVGRFALMATDDGRYSQDPQVLRGVFGMQSLRISISSNSTVTLNYFGWLDAYNLDQPQYILDVLEQIRQTPGMVATGAGKDGMIKKIMDANQTQRLSMAIAAGNNRPSHTRDHVVQHGAVTHYLTPSTSPRNYPEKIVNVLYSYFYVDNDAMRAVFNTGSHPDGMFSTEDLRVSGSATYAGEAGGIFVAGTIGGIYAADVNMSATFSNNDVALQGHMDYMINGGLSGQLFLHRVATSRTSGFKNGSISCTRGCMGGSGYWGADFIRTGDNGSTETPQALGGTYGLAGARHGNISLDLFGIFTGILDDPFPTALDESRRVGIAAGLSMVVSDRSKYSGYLFNFVSEPMNDGYVSHGSNVAGSRVGVAFNNDRLSRAGGLLTVTNSQPGNSWQMTSAGRISGQTLAFMGRGYDSTGKDLPLWLYGDPSMQLPSSHPGASRGWVAGMWYRNPGDFGIFADGTRVSVTNALSGMATFVGTTYGMIRDIETYSTHRHTFSKGQISLTVHWGNTPSVRGRMFVNATVSAHATQGVNPYTLNMTLDVGSTMWIAQRRSFNGTIGCVAGCSLVSVTERRVNSTTTLTSTVTVAYQKWAGMPVMGRSSIGAPSDFVGTYVLKQFINSTLWDYIGWFGASNTATDTISFSDRILRAPGHTTSEAVALTDALSWYNLIDRRPGTPASSRAGTAASVGLNLGLPPTDSGRDFWILADHREALAAGELRTGFWKSNIHNQPGDYRLGAFVEAPDITTDLTLSGNASYSGHASGIYASSSGKAGAYVASLTMSVGFSADPDVTMSFGYDFGGARGTVTMNGGTWNSSNYSFTAGDVTCNPTCPQGSWAGKFFEPDDTISANEQPDAFAGHFGAAGMLHNGDTFDTTGLLVGIKD